MRIITRKNSAIAVKPGSSRYALDFVVGPRVAPFTPAYQKDHPLHFDNRVTQALGIDIPILQAPMGWIARSQLASAVSKTGALGIIETSSGELDAIRVEIQKMKELVDIHYPDAAKITRVMDNLNTHRLSCLYEAFTPAEARRLIEKIEVVHTPKHGSWLNMAECELSVLEKQCLGERIGDQGTLRVRVHVWNGDRNHRSKKIDWQFRTTNARIKLRRLYPHFQME